MRKYLRSAAYLAVAAWFSVAHAGSYEDFFRSIKEDDATTVASLLQRGFDPNTPSPDGLTGLYLALREPAPKVAAVLVGWPQTKVEVRTAQDESPLMMASLKGETDFVRKLIARDADVNKPGWAPLHYAATGGHLDVMELLLENNAFIDAESPNGTTPLMMAAMYGTPAAVKLLLDAGADVGMVNKLGLTALDFARRGNRPDAIAMIQAAMDQARAKAAAKPPAPAALPVPATATPPSSNEPTALPAVAPAPAQPPQAVPKAMPLPAPPPAVPTPVLPPAVAGVSAAPAPGPVRPHPEPASVQPQPAAPAPAPAPAVRQPGQW